MTLPTKSHLNDNPTEGELKQALGNVYDTLVWEYFRLNITASSDDLVVSLKNSSGTDPSVSEPVAFRMRHPTMTNGYSIPVNFSAASGITVPDGGSLGFDNAETGKAYIWAVYDGTNKDIGISRTQFHDESILHSTTTVGTGSDSESVIYTTTGRTSAAIKLLAEITITRGTDIWDAAPTNIFVANDRKPLLIMPYGCVPANNTGDATNDMDFSAGIQLDSTREHMIIAGDMTKRADADFAVGSGNGARASGASAWDAGDWHWFLVGKKNDPHAHDYVLDSSASGANVLADAAVAAAGFNILKRVHSHRTSGAAWLPINATEIAVGLLLIELKTPLYQFDKDWSGTDDAAQTGTLPNAPGGIKVAAIMGVNFQDTTIAGSSALLLSSLDQSDTAANSGNAAFVGDLKLLNDGSGVDRVTNGRFKIKTSTARTFRYRAVGSTVDHTASVCLHAWEDSRL
jgi:hypothetical protein